MKKRTKLLTVFIVLLSIALTGCGQQSASTQDTNDMGNIHDMHAMHNMHNQNQQSTHEETELFLPTSKTDTKVAKQTLTKEIENSEEITITADIIKKEINGKEHTMYAYNEQIPGPILKVKQGTQIKVHFKNNIDQETTVHWHGLRHDNKDDGIPGISQPPVEPGETYDYTLKFPDAGMYWYHPHIREDSQQDLGLAGMIVVEPKEENYYNQVNKEEILVFDDILLENNELVGYGKVHATHALMGRFGNTLLINGNTEYKLTVNSGEVVRFFIGNVANTRPLNLAFENAKIKVIGSDLSKYEKETFQESIVIHPAERYIVEVLFDKPGTHKLIHKTPEKTYTLGTVTVNEEQITNDYQETFNNLKQNNNDIRSTITAQELQKQSSKAPDHELTLTVKTDNSMDMDHMAHMNHMNHDMHSMHQEQELQGIEWEDNMQMMNKEMTTKEVTWIIQDEKTKRENMDIQIKTKKDSYVKIKIFNDPNSPHPMQHPIHLHGQRFLVLKTDNTPNENLVWKDTTIVPAGSTIELLVDATNPGHWMLHCHIAEHLEAGMMSSFIVEE